MWQKLWRKALQCRRSLQCTCYQYFCLITLVWCCTGITLSTFMAACCQRHKESPKGPNPFKKMQHCNYIAQWQNADNTKRFLKTWMWKIMKGSVSCVILIKYIFVPLRPALSISLMCGSFSKLDNEMGTCQRIFLNVTEEIACFQHILSM